MTTDPSHTQPVVRTAPPPEREERRPDLRAAPESPPVERRDLERGRAKLERVLAK